MSEKNKPIRFGAEFGPDSVTGTTKGVSLATFKRLVWISSIGGLVLVVIALEMAITGGGWWALAIGMAGIVIALFPSNFEIVGMDAPPDLVEDLDED